MRIIRVSVEGKFDTERVRDDEHWQNVRDVWVYWSDTNGWFVPPMMEWPNLRTGQMSIVAVGTF